ncbi:hypothetical protein GTY86_10995 [Streptomyces sp. SID5770]|uniref:hypothetical protein n=1 Tax=Streptomyces sp. SID5770 TaxID=2690308 RepID=UPI0013853C55|nr:hypothetical protein [Streptomyces sp. SID5770]MZE51816.1 hypothetical protein [Streptomyces sp. SID5770]
MAENIISFRRSGEIDTTVTEGWPWIEFFERESNRITPLIADIFDENPWVNLSQKR